MIYKGLKAGQWQRPIHRNYRLRCCDCGLVHKFDFRIVRKGVEFRAYRDSRATIIERRKLGEEN